MHSLQPWRYQPTRNQFTAKWLCGTQGAQEAQNQGGQTDCSVSRLACSRCLAHLLLCCRYQAEKKEFDAKIALYEEQSTTIQIPPGKLTFSHSLIILDSSGCAIVFVDRILHCIQKKTLKHQQLRLHTGFHLSATGKALYDRTEAVADFGVFKLPSGQQPEMFPRRLRNMYLHKPTKTMGGRSLIEWSKHTFQPQCLEQRQGGWEETKEKPKDYECVQQVLSGLETLGLRNPRSFPDYGNDELATLTPNCSWQFKLANKFQKERFGTGTNNLGGNTLFLDLGQVITAPASIIEGKEVKELKESKEDKASEIAVRKKAQPKRKRQDDDLSQPQHETATKKHHGSPMDLGNLMTDDE